MAAAPPAQKADPFTTNAKPLKPDDFRDLQRMRELAGAERKCALTRTAVPALAPPQGADADKKARWEAQEPVKLRKHVDHVVECWLLVLLFKHAVRAVAAAAGRVGAGKPRDLC
jgi:hypothetical protein